MDLIKAFKEKWVKAFDHLSCNVNEGQALQLLLDRSTALQHNMIQAKRKTKIFNEEKVIHSDLACYLSLTGKKYIFC